MDELTSVSSKKLRNRVAGYISHLISISHGRDSSRIEVLPDQARAWTVGSKYILGMLVPRFRRVFVDVDEGKFKDAVQFLKDEGFAHLSTITGFEAEDGIELLYHLNRGGIELTLRSARKKRGNGIFESRRWSPPRDSNS